MPTQPPLSDSQPVAFAEADEDLFQKVRNELLGQAEGSPGTVPGALEEEDPASQARASAQRQRQSRLVIVLAILGTIACVLGWLNPESLGPLRVGGMVVLVIVAVEVIGIRVQLKVANRKAPLPPVSPPRRFSSWSVFLLSLVCFVCLGALLLTPIELGWLIGVLLLHESGHFIGMRYFGYRDLKMFFIPLFGAAVSGEKRGVPAWQEAIVLLLGPLPGLILGCGIYYLDLAVPQPILRTGATWLVTINFLNLLPFEPLDGGRFCNRLLFSRFRWLEAVTVVLATVGLVFVCWGPGWILLALSGAFALFVLAPTRYRTATAAATMQSHWPDLRPGPAEMTEEQWKDLFTITRRQFGSNPNLLAAQMKNVHTRALLHPESSGVTFRLFAVYLTALLLGIVTASVTHLGEDTGRWPIEIGQQLTGSKDGEPAPDD